MTAYFIRRFLLIIPTFLGITLLVFTITRMVPGGPIERMMNQALLAGGEASHHRTDTATGQTLSDKQIAQLKAYYGFDKPILTSYREWLSKVLVLDLGHSTRYSDPVWSIIKQRLPISLFYGISTLILTYSVCIPLGIAKALRHGGHFDHVSSAIVFFGYAVPSYVVGIALLVLFSAHWHWFPLGGFVSDDFADFGLWGKVKDIAWHAVLPLTAYMAGSFAITTFMMKNALMDNLSADYVRTAMAKGQDFRHAVTGHAMRNSMIAIATSLGTNISALLGGSFLIEKIFNIDGIGLLGYDSIVERDYPIVMGILVVTSLLYLFGNILSDILVALLDPRIRFGKS